MDESPVRIAIELEGVAASPRFAAAVDELAAAAVEMIGEAADVSGFAYDLNPNEVSLKEIRPGVLGFNIGMPPTFRPDSYSDGRGGTYGR